ncbi:hypothetical protein AALP_AA6G042200 [Arabis alpina]|uniref:BRCT domain-containing protein n=1 Tax=Arabis alpina TaxID=50452 RepID=A0A087GM13_ARAAL|nr:hypothetical protein AALP_AA6G042200 [Arabis alpina]
MNNRINTEVSDSDSEPPSPSDSNHRFEANENLGFGDFKDTELIDEAITLDIPFQKLYDDTEVVDNEETLDLEFDCLDQVVNDSEDEEDEGNGSVAPVLRERSLVKAAGMLLESDGSNDHECCKTGKQESNCDIVTGSSRISGYSHGGGVDFVDSQEPGEASQAEALGFVDQFLKDKDLNFSPVALTSGKRKSPPFSGAKGRQSLAKRIKTRSPARKMSVFDWGSDQCDVSDPQNSPATCKNIKRGEDRVDDDPGVKKGCMDLCEDRKVSTHPSQGFMQTSSVNQHKMVQIPGLSQGIMFISHMDAQLQDKGSNGQSEPEEDFIDVGISTQIAAEAMSALLHTPCTREEACESDPIPGSVSEMRDNDTIEDGPERDNESGPRKVRNSKKQRNFRKIKRTRKNTSATTCLLNLCEWRHPRAKRSRLRQRHHISSRKPLVAKDRSEANTLSSELRVPLSGTRQASSCQSVVNDSKVVNHASPRKIYGRSRESPCSKDSPRPFLLKELTRLGGPGNVGDFMWKDLRRRRNLAHVRILFSQNLDVETIKQQKKIMSQLGISPASSSADSTHFITDRFARTKNMLEAIALGKPVVTPLWLESCGQTRCLIDEKSYILKDSKKEKEGFCLLTSLARSKQHPLLKGLKVCITPNIKPGRGMIADLVKASQGQVVEISEIIDPDDLLILSCEEDRNLCLAFINQGAVIYSSELLLNGIVIQKLEYGRHSLFTIADKRNQRNKKFTATCPLLSAY